MNLLAHCYLSGGSENILIGNFIADSIKGKNYAGFNQGIINGIQLHRQIDEFTDNHETVRQSKRRLAPKYGKYASVIVDIFYDHFLAIDWGRYSQVDLEIFSLQVYATLNAHKDILPEKVQEFLPYMIRQDWLYNYRTLEGIDKSLHGMARRAKFDSHMDLATQDLKKDHELYAQEFYLFFPELVDFVTTLLIPLQKT